ncbi:Nif3-like dinuclear metal center hexameric protein [Candidatus Parcubacteria bacterium]|nr:Nif3-like dinuclear metal center hexameric protein [Candidatus Parcubacteria bacterium]
MEDRNKIVKFCEEYLQVKNFKDSHYNGLQVEGDEKISKIITGVSFSQKLIKAAIEKNAQMIIVHHGIFSNQISSPPQFKGVIKNRLKLLFENNINLCGFHLPLDEHPIIGNNISLIKLLGLEKANKIISPKYGQLGFIGKINKKIGFDEFVEFVNKRLNTKSYTISAGPKIIKKIGIISGKDPSDYKIAAELGADTYLTGEIEEFIVREVEETGINFISAGHYNTEKLGVQNLGNLIAKKFRVKAEFIDIPCDI